MIIPKIKTEVGVVIILITALLVGIFTVVSFDKTVEDLDNIQKSIDANQRMLNDIKTNNLKNPGKK